MTVHRTSGHTLPELLIAAVILAMLGTLATPLLTSSRNQQLDAAHTLTLQAIRFARDEALRTGLVHSVALDSTASTVSVFQANDFSSISDPLPLVPHPISKQPYEVSLAANRGTGFTGLKIGTLTFDGIGTQSRIDFSARGEPHYITKPLTRHRLTGASIDIQQGSTVRTITVDPITGAAR